MYSLVSIGDITIDLYFKGEELTSKGDRFEFAAGDKNHMSISVILLRKDGTRTVIKHSDPKKHIEINPHSIDRIQKSQIVFMGNLPDISIDERTSLLDKINTDANIVALNFGSKDCTKGIKYLRPLIDHADILFLNRYEFAELGGEKPHKVNLKKNHW